MGHSYSAPPFDGLAGRGLADVFAAHQRRDRADPEGNHDERAVPGDGAGHAPHGACQCPLTRCRSRCFGCTGVHSTALRVGQAGRLPSQGRRPACPTLCLISTRVNGACCSRSLPVSANALPVSADEYLRFLPEIILSIAGTLLMILEPLTGAGKKNALAGLTFVAFVAALAAAIWANSSPGTAFSGLLVVDGYGTLFRALVIVVGALTVFLSNPFLNREGANSGEYYALVLYSVVGQCVMVTANDLIMVFIGLEISSIASYVLAGYLRDDPRANESALKYFLLGSFATAFLLYGVALIYGAAGSTNLSS